MLTGEVLQLAATQHGVLTVEQLRRRFGISRAASAAARRRGLVVEVAPGILRLTSSPETFESRCMAASLRSNELGFLSGWTAARIHGLRSMPDAPIHLTVPSGSRRDYPSWCSIHCSSWFADDQFVRRPDGLCVATPMRMLFGLAAAFNQFRFERAAEDAWHRRLVTPEQAAEYLTLHRCRGKDGVRVMERWLNHALDRDRATQSDLERRLIEAVVGCGLPEPERQYRVVLGNGEAIHLDLAWPRARLAVEPGASWWHGGDLAARRDRRRDRACAELGWLVLRFDERVLDDVRDAAQQVDRVYRRRLRELSQIW